MKMAIQSKNVKKPLHGENVDKICYYTFISMTKAKLTKPQIAALMVNLKNELKILFDELGVEHPIVTDLSLFIFKEFNIDPESEDIYKIFVQ